MMLYTGFLETFGDAPVTLWTMAKNAQQLSGSVKVETFPAIRPFKEFPYNYLRRLNEFAWDALLRIPSRESMLPAVWTDPKRAGL